MITEQELWKPIEGYESLYRVSTLGRVQSFGHRYGVRFLRPQIAKDGYLRVDLRRNCGGRHYSIARLVAFAFVPNPENKPSVNHLNGIVTDNQASNLEWATRKEQAEHAIRTGLWRTPVGTHRNSYRDGSACIYRVNGIVPLMSRADYARKELEARRNWRAVKYQNGLCWRCGGKRSDTQLCLECREEMKQYGAMYRRLRKEQIK